MNSALDSGSKSHDVHTNILKHKKKENPKSETLLALSTSDTRCSTCSGPRMKVLPGRKKRYCRLNSRCTKIGETSTVREDPDGPWCSPKCPSRKEAGKIQQGHNEKEAETETEWRLQNAGLDDCSDIMTSHSHQKLEETRRRSFSTGSRGSVPLLTG